MELYKFALEAWKQEYKDYVSKFGGMVLDGDFKTKFNAPIAPTSYAKQYENVIKQLEMSSDNIITLDANEFRNYILDEWNFRDAFYTQTTRYMGDFKNESTSVIAFSASNMAKLSSWTDENEF